MPIVMLKDTSRMDRTVLDILTNLLQRGKHVCTFDPLSNDLFDRVFVTAGKNKISYVLFHFLTCKTCNKKLTPESLQKLASFEQNRWLYTIRYQIEKQCIIDECAKKSIKIVFYKDTEKQKPSGKYGTYLYNSDMDVLCSRRDIKIYIQILKKRGYVQKNRLVPKEITFKHPKNSFEIDVHEFIAFPHFAGMPESEKNMIIRLSNECIAHSRKHSSGEYMLDPTWFLLTACVRYFYNDMLTGIGPLIDIAEYYLRMKAKIHIKTVFRIAASYNIESEVRFVLALAAVHGNRNVFFYLKPHIPRYIYILAHAYSLSDIMLFPYINIWNSTKHISEAQQKFRTLYIVKLLLNKQTPLVRHFRPRIFFLLAVAYVRYVKDSHTIYNVPRPTYQSSKKHIHNGVNI